MSEEVKTTEKEKAAVETDTPNTVLAAEAEEKTKKNTADEGAEFSFDSEVEELPEEIKQKLEKNKAARAKKKLIKKKKKKVARIVKVGRAYIQATYNNTIITLTDTNGDVISWASAGLAGFKGAKKATPYAAQIITKIAAQKAREEYGLEEVSVFVSGVGTGREAAIRALNANNLNVSAIKDMTPVPHNGCRPKKPRRV
ncbi:TPA: 30S ribosomal protein S11 [Candidatus Falkowbacteria bacterium]|nr:MAG: 30S ribosomal protein S11 [Candidatus Falkowbacteria bacterium GW2011_GWF2_43_32]HBA36774.1 30S ribosomal protein S11 [Candidatus Falkowbacteria bacterium]